MDTHDHSHDNQVREREVIVTDNGRSGSGVGAVFAAIIGLLIVLLVGFFLFSGFGGDGDGGVQVPDEVDVNVNPGGDEGGGQ